MSAAHDTDPQGHGFEGRLLGGFRMEREIACGGMATVYLAHKAGPGGFGHPAAVKVIHPHLARDRDFVEMFLDEARIVSCINHPNVCRVLDFGKAEGTYYLAMEYVMGETWGDVLHALKQRPSAQGMIPALLAQVLAQACEGLHAAHEARDAEGRALSIVHRDISPQNLIIGYDGSVRVLDFGIASAAERLHTTRNGTIKGRFAYMAPEQMRGMPVDRRADVWSLGVVLWEGLAQKRLFKRDTEAETVLAVTQDPLPLLQDVGHPVPSAMARIAQQALSRDRDQRYQTARELGLELSRFAVSSLVPVGMAEVSLWMSRLFAERIDQKRENLREAARAAESEKQRASIAAAPLVAPAPVITTDVEFDKTAWPTGSPSVSAIREVERDSLELVIQKRRMAGPLLGVSAFLFVALLGALIVPMFKKSPATPATAVAPASEQKQLAAQAVEEQAAQEPAPEETAPPPQEQNAPEVAPPEPAPERSAATKPVAAARRRERPMERAHEPARARTTEPARTARAAEPDRADSSPRKRLEAATAFGSVSVATPGGWADVYVGPRKLGTTPGRFELPVGTHVLRLRPFGKQPEIVRRVQVSEDGAQKLKVTLE